MASNRKAWRTYLSDAALTCIAGIAIGMFVGLSASPVAAALVASLIGGTVSVVLVFKQGEGWSEQRRGRLFFAAVLACGCLGGALSGMSLRGVRWSEEATIEAWVRLGIPRERVVSALFDQTFVAPAALQASPANLVKQPVLLASTVDEVQLLRGRSGGDLRQAMKKATLKALRLLEKSIPDDEALQDIVDSLLQVH